MSVKLTPQDRAVEAQPRRYDPTKNAWLAGCMAALAAPRLVFQDASDVGESNDLLSQG